MAETPTSTDVHLGSTPDVDIAGFPFLTQALAREFGEVSATAEDVVVRTGDGELRLARLRVVFTDVTTDRDVTRFAAERGRAVATISYAELGRLTGLDVTYVGSSAAIVASISSHAWPNIASTIASLESKWP